MKYLSLDEVLAIHYEAIKLFGGSQGLRDFGLLHAATERPKATFGGQDLYENVFQKAAALFHSLILNHPFVDGNKRTAYVSCSRFLFINGYTLVAKHKELISFILKIEREKPSMETIATWLSANCKKNAS